MESSFKFAMLTFDDSISLHFSLIRLLRNLVHMACCNTLRFSFGEKTSSMYQVHQCSFLIRWQQFKNYHLASTLLEAQTGTQAVKLSSSFLLYDTNGAKYA